MTARREWTPEECKDAYAEAITYPSTIAEGVGRALLTLRQERDEARAALAQARVDALEEAAKVAAGFAPPEGYDDFTIEGRAAMQAGDNIAAAIRALKEKP